MHVDTTDDIKQKTQQSTVNLIYVNLIYFKIKKQAANSFMTLWIVVTSAAMFNCNTTYQIRIACLYISAMGK